jgi:transposase
MEMNQLTRITLAWELFGEGVNKTHIAQQLSVNRETVRIWIKAIKSNPLGVSGFIDDYLSAKKGERTKRKIDGLLKERICLLREENRDCCGQKIQKYLQDEYDIRLSVATIYKILGERYQLRSKWKKNQVRGLVPKAEAPRQVIQMDSVDFGQVFAFTGIDIFTKEVMVNLYPALTSLEGLDFLNQAIIKFKHTKLLQTDGGSEFKAEFRNSVFSFTDRFRVARPYKKNEQSYIESFNRSLRKECLGWNKYLPVEIPLLQKDLNEYLDYYHSKRAHLSLNLKTPNDILEEYYQVADI